MTVFFGTDFNTSVADVYMTVPTFTCQYWPINDCNPDNMKVPMCKRQLQSYTLHFQIFKLCVAFLEIYFCEIENHTK